jgi:hypothetical protein
LFSVRAHAPSRARRGGPTRVRAAGDGESFLDKINPFKRSKGGELAKREAQSRADKNALITDDTRKQLFGDGLLGKVVSGVINQVASGLKEQISAAAEVSEMTYDTAVRACKIDSRVRRAMGEDIQATPPASQFSSTSSVNGKRTQTTTVGFSLRSADGRGGRAMVQAVSTSDERGRTVVNATVSLETGEQFMIADCAGEFDVVEGERASEIFETRQSRVSGGAADATVDVDADDVIDV